MDWLPMLKDFGFPAVALGAFGWAVWQSVRWVAAKASEYGERGWALIQMLASEHVTFLKKVEAAVEALTGNITELKSDVADVKADIQGIKQRIGVNE